MSTDAAAHLRAAREGLVAAPPTAGRAWCAAWTAEVDATLAGLADTRPASGRLSVVATGGYGRGELCPESDIDLLLLHDRVAHAELEAAVRHVVYPLWDAGLRVGHAVRDVRDAGAVADDLDTATALLDARTLAGDPGLLHRAHADLLGRVRRKPARFLERLSEADAARRHRHGDLAEALEPDLKDGAGGLRDVQSLRWAAAAVLGEVALDPLVGAGYLGAPDRSRLARAYERLLAVRVALHLTTGRKTDALTLDVQQAVGERLGHADGDGATAADGLLRALFLDARAVDHLHRRAWSLLTADAQRGRRGRRGPERRLDHDLGVTDGVVHLDPGAGGLGDPSLPTRLLHALVTAGPVLDRVTASRLSREVESLTAPLSWDVAARQRFLGALWAGEVAVEALAELDSIGLLVAMLPEWAALRGRPQRNPFHRYALDRHALHAAAVLGDLVRDEPWALEALERVDDREGLMLGVLLHDVGKAHGEPHSETGVAIARAVVARVGAPQATADLVERLVRHHLLLPDVATRRDLADPGLAASVAETVGDVETLTCLHLLAVADGCATGPSAWGAWKAALVATLVDKVRAVLEDVDPDEGTGAASNAHDAQELAPSLGVDARAVREHLRLLPPRYAAAVSPRAIVRHAAVAAAPLDVGEVRTRVTAVDTGTEAGSYDELDVVAGDRPGLFSKVAGVIALHGGSVLSAHAFTRDDGLAVDAFTVRRPSGAGGAWWAGVEGDLVEAMSGRLAVRARLMTKIAAQREPRRRLPLVATTVEVHADASGQATLVEVHTHDAIGVLYRIAAALAELELDIVSAKVDTIGEEAVDVFYVRGSDGRPLAEDHGREVVLAVATALATAG